MVDGPPLLASSAAGMSSKAGSYGLGLHLREVAGYRLGKKGGADKTLRRMPGRCLKHSGHARMQMQGGSLLDSIWRAAGRSKQRSPHLRPGMHQVLCWVLTIWRPEAQNEAHIEVGRIQRREQGMAQEQCLRTRMGGYSKQQEERTSRYGGYRCEKGIAATPRLRLGRCIRTAASSALARSTSP